MDDEAITKAFSALWPKPEDGFPTKKPLLAHYTSISVMESILANNEVWLSNPLVMNDLQEVRFGINQGNEIVLSHLNDDDFVAACGGAARVKLFQNWYSYYNNEFQNDHAFDLYVLCLSEHDEKENEDGLLSMWRGYGGNGTGAAIVLNTAKINAGEDAPLIIAPVRYGSDEARVGELLALFKEFTRVISELSFDDEKLYIPAFYLYERIKLMSIFTKHKGFSEEREWRVAYLKSNDSNKKLTDMFGYCIGPRGVEPKLKLNIEKATKAMGDTISLEEIIHQIILGPSLSSPFALLSIGRMLDQLGKSSLKNKVRASAIPFRPL